LGFSCNICETAGTSDFKFGVRLGFAKGHHKITRRRKRGRVPGLVELPIIWMFSFNIYTVAEAIDFKFGTQLLFANAHHKITTIGESGCGLGLGSSPKFWSSSIILLQRLKLATSNLARCFGLRRPTLKPHPEEKVGVALG